MVPTNSNHPWASEKFTKYSPCLNMSEGHIITRHELSKQWHIVTNDSAWIYFRKDWTFLHPAATVSRSQSLRQHPNKPDRCSLRYNSYSGCRRTVRPATRLSCYSWIKDAPQRHGVVCESWGQMPTSVNQMVVVYKMHLLFMFVFVFSKEGFFLWGKPTIRETGWLFVHKDAHITLLPVLIHLKLSFCLLCSELCIWAQEWVCSWMSNALLWLAFFCTWERSLAHCEP